MPSNKSTTYHQSVQFFVQFFSKKFVFLLDKQKKNFKNFLQNFFTKFYLKSTKFYHILLSFTSSGTQFYQIPATAGQCSAMFMWRKGLSSNSRMHHRCNPPPPPQIP